MVQDLIGPGKARELLFRGLENRTPGVRARAAQGLGVCGAVERRDDLLKLKESETSGQVLKMIETALERLDGLEE